MVAVGVFVCLLSIIYFFFILIVPALGQLSVALGILPERVMSKLR